MSLYLIPSVEHDLHKEETKKKFKQKLNDCCIYKTIYHHLSIMGHSVPVQAHGVPGEAVTAQARQHEGTAHGGCRAVRGQEPPRWGGHPSHEGREGLSTALRPLHSGSVTS